MRTSLQGMPCAMFVHLLTAGTASLVHSFHYLFILLDSDRNLKRLFRKERECNYASTASELVWETVSNANVVLLVRLLR